MPKKQKKQNSMSEDELSELLQKSLKETGADRKFEEESDEEKEIDKNINLESLEFHQFFRDPGEDSGTPVLERIAGSQVPRPIFVGGIPQTGTVSTEERNGGDDFKYMPSTNQPGEATYTGSTHVDTETERVDFSRVGRERSELGNWDSWSASEQLSAREQSLSQGGVERTGIVRGFDTSVAGRSKEREEVKYEKYNPKKIPSGR